MIAHVTVLFLDFILSSFLGCFLLFYPEDMNNLYFDTPYNLIVRILLQIIGTMILGIGFGLSMAIESKNKKMMQYFLDMRAITWVFQNIFLMINKEIIHYNTYCVTLGICMAMTVLTVSHTSMFKIKPSFYIKTKKPEMKRSLTPEPVNYNKIRINKTRKIKEC